MEDNQTLEVYGTLLKQEKLLPVGDRVVRGSLVFESLNPFPGYYSEEPGSAPPLYLYLALDKDYRLEQILRAAREIGEQTGSAFDAGKGTVIVAGEEIPVLRLRHFGSFDSVASLQEAFTGQGIGALKKQLRNLEYAALVRIVKIMYLIPLDPFLYLDGREEYHGYFEIPGYLTWEQFETVTRRVKYNWFGSKFDAANGSFFHDGKLHDYVRIYSDVVDKSYLHGIRGLYLEKMSHPLE